MPPSRPLRLLHFDLKTRFSYGDQLLFELVRHVFNGYGDGNVFDVSDSRPLRSLVEVDLVERINRDYDAIIVGGGGLFLRSTNTNPNSGWQWNMPIDLLDRLEKPIIVFAVGNTRFFGQEDFDPVFGHHLTRTIQGSAFFGLRNHGSIDSIRSYVSPEAAERIQYQPCPTVLLKSLVPDLVTAPTDDRRLGVQLGLELPHIEGGFGPDRLFPQMVAVVDELNRRGWTVDAIAHKRTDIQFYREHGEGRIQHLVELFRRPEVLFTGITEYARYPVVLGARGHAQMIPFGLGNLPLSIRVNPKVEFFARDVGHPEWVIDPLEPDFVERAVETVESTWADRDAQRAEISTTHESLLDVTLDNLESIHQRLAGPESGRRRRSFVPYSPRERRLAAACYDESYERRELQQQLTQAIEGRRESIEQSRRHLRALGRRDESIARLRAELRSAQRSVERRESTIESLRVDVRRLRRVVDRREARITELEAAPDVEGILDMARRLERSDASTARKLYRAAVALGAKAEQLPPSERGLARFLPVRLQAPLRRSRARVRTALGGWRRTAPSEPND